MDPISLTGPSVALIKTTLDIIIYINSVAGAKKERARLREELRSLKSMLEKLTDETCDAEEGDPWKKTMEALSGPGGPLTRLQDALSAIKSKLEPKKGLKGLLTSLRWPFDEKEIAKMISVIERDKALLHLALTQDYGGLIREMKKTSDDSNRLVDELTKGLNELKADMELVRDSQADLLALEKAREAAEMRKSILDWISRADYAAQQADFISRRQPKTGRWFLDSARFKAWVETEKQTLFCQGIPGAGKTILASVAVDELTSRFEGDLETGVAYVYCNFRRHDEQSVGHLLASLVRQLVQRRPSLPGFVKSVYDSAKDKQRPPTIGDISKMLPAAAKTYSRTYIIIDALDECRMPDGSQLIKKLFDLQNETGANILVTSRNFPSKEELQSGTLLEIRAADEDVQQYLDGQMHRLRGFATRNLALQEEIKSKITEAIDGMFLLAKLHLDSLVGKTTPRALRAALEALPTGSKAYATAYEGAMERIEGQCEEQADLAKRVLSWIIYAKRPLHIDELQLALAVEPGRSELGEDNFTDNDDMISACAGLVTVDQKTNIIRLQTQERWFSNKKTEITEACVTYLSFSVFGSAARGDKIAFTRSLWDSFLGYAARYWSFHAREAFCDQVNDFLESVGKVRWFMENLCRLYDGEGTYDLYWSQHPEKWTVLHLAAYFGIYEAVDFPLQHGQDVDARNGHGRTPLMCAAHKGHLVIVQELLKNGADTNLKDDWGHMTPLAHAAWGGHGAVVEQLLEAGAGIDPADPQSAKPFLLAAAMGDLAVVTRLLKEGVDIEARSRLTHEEPPSSETAACRWYLCGHCGKAVVQEGATTELIMTAAVEHYRAGNHRVYIKQYDLGSKRTCAFIPPLVLYDCAYTALMFAAASGHEAIVRLLLEKGADIEAGSELTPLALAATHGQTNIVGLLLEQGAQLESTDIVFGQTPLAHAASEGHDAVVKLLAERGADIQAQSQITGHTARELAVLQGHSHVAAFLAEKGARVCSKHNMDHALCQGFAKPSRMFGEGYWIIVSDGGSRRRPLPRGCGRNDYCTYMSLQ
ncbi:hypothetical protein QBC46DRAFT_403003 [Diplogelasinospora grovesii]|uniref:NACHT domain-containing protein n=1 Tax=Diplogelasinospora grovesii TaxID=303347 RepID=A0AAN6SAD7_9PEZI|nr:hypothetical protein QBC46DRAFT_403003 [Diplogelasinospora grovesii]